MASHCAAAAAAAVVATLVLAHDVAVSELLMGTWEHAVVLRMDYRSANAGLQTAIIESTVMFSLSCFNIIVCTYHLSDSSLIQVLLSYRMYIIA